MNEQLLPNEATEGEEYLEKREQQLRLNEVRIKRLNRNLVELQYVISCLIPLVNNEVITESYRQELNAQINETLDATRKLLKSLPGDGLVQ
jgi:hypothetical protein